MNAQAVESFKDFLGKPPLNLKAGDILNVLLNEPRESRLFIVSDLWKSTEEVIYGNFDTEYGDCPPRALYPRDVVRISKIGDSSSLLEDLIRDRNNLRKRLARIEHNIGNLLK